MNIRKLPRLEKLKMSAEEIKILEEETRAQARSVVWKEARCKRIMASKFGKICKMRLSTSSANNVQEIIRNILNGTEATEHGIAVEPTVRKWLESPVCIPRCKS